MTILHLRISLSTRVARDLNATKLSIHNEMLLYEVTAASIQVVINQVMYIGIVMIKKNNFCLSDDFTRYYNVKHYGC